MQKHSEQDGPEADLIVLGGGAAGLAAAVRAAWGGLRVTLIDTAPVLGGTTAWSGGWIWCPGNPLAGEPGAADAARAYLQAVTGAHFQPGRVDAFLRAAPEMVEFFHARTALQFDGPFPIPDTYSDLPGAGTGGRSVIARPYKARGLGADLALLRLPARETTFLGMTIQAGADLRAFMTVTRKPRSALHVTRRLSAHLWGMARHGRGMNLRNGNALAARLIRSALDLGVLLRPGTAVAALERKADRVGGVILEDGRRIHARIGVVLATGGFGQEPARFAGLMSEAPLSLSVPEARGGGLALAEAVGGQLRGDAAMPAALCPVSRVPWPEGGEGRFPHIIDRGKPGVIGVLADGRRFCNEGLGYHDYVTALLSATPAGSAPRSWLVCDRRFLHRYGLGIVRPFPVPHQGWIRRGYLKSGRSPAELARACGIDPAGLETTLRLWNRDARAGTDSAFGRGSSAYMRLQGDPDHGPNPCMAPIEAGPFYAVEVVPGSFSTFAGLDCDGEARVLEAGGRPIPGLWAAGADAASPFGGFYPAGGINLGPALTFGFVAGRAAAGEAAARSGAAA